MDNDGSGTHDQVVSTTIARQRLTAAMNEAAAQGYPMFVGEIAVPADVAGAGDAWADFIDYIERPPPSAFVGYTWWAGGWPDWWKKTHAPNFSVSPTDPHKFVGETTNMKMIQNNF
jgi:hypothetical protein